MSKAAPTLKELATKFRLDLRGDGAQVITGVAALTAARPDQLAFLANPKYAAQLATTQAAAVILRREHDDACPVSALFADDPYVAYARVASVFERLPAATPGIHPSAVVAEDAKVDNSASVGPLCVIGNGARIEAGAVLGPHCVIGEDCVVGAQSRLVARVTLVVRVSLGKRVLIHPGAVLGADGFGLALDRSDSTPGHWIKVPQLGGVRIGDDCEIGANTTIDRGAIDEIGRAHV